MTRADLGRITRHELAGWKALERLRAADRAAQEDQQP